MSEIKESISKWLDDTCLGYIRLPVNQDIERAMNLSGGEIRSMELTSLDEVVVTLANYLVYLAKEMGTLYARVKYFEQADDERARLERIKLSIIKPVHDAVRHKLDAFKTIYYCKSRGLHVGSNRG
jgi:hypothetical protein